MPIEILSCPSCGGDQVTLVEETSYMANSGKHYCHSVKTQDSDARSNCLDCGWSGQHKDLMGVSAMSADNLSEALRGTIAELESVLIALNAERMPHDGDEFHERLEAAKKALADHEADRALAALTAEQRRLGMYDEAEKQEPVAWMWQHDETSRTGFVSGDFDRKHWEKFNPRLKIVSPCYRTPQQEPDRLDATAILQAIARGWCHPANIKKVMDADLALAIAAEVSAAIDAAIDAAKEAKP